MLKVYLIGSLCAFVLNMIIYIKNKRIIDKGVIEQGSDPDIFCYLVACLITSSMVALFSWLGFFIVLPSLFDEEE